MLNPLMINLREGKRKVEDVLEDLCNIQVKDLEQKREVAYMRAWCSMLRDRWDEAAQFILPEEISGETITDLRELGSTERRRRPYYLLVMGKVASRLRSYDQAIEHYTLCLRLLGERRMNDPNRRIRALLGLGRCYLETGSSTNALEYYQQALRLCYKENRQFHLPHIFYGLGETFRHLNHLECALEYGKQALRLSTEHGDQHSLCQIYRLLGDIHRQMGNLETANASYTEALVLAMCTESADAIVTCLTTLADLRLQEEKPEDAWRYCEMALDSRQRDALPSCVGRMYVICGKVREALAHKAGGQEHVEQAISSYEQAIKTLGQINARSELAETYSLLAHLLEESGRPDQAIATWKLACSIYDPSCLSL